MISVYEVGKYCRINKKLAGYTQCRKVLSDSLKLRLREGESVSEKAPYMLVLAERSSTAWREIAEEAIKLLSPEQRHEINKFIADNTNPVYVLSVTPNYKLDSKKGKA